MNAPVEKWRRLLCGELLNVGDVIRCEPVFGGPYNRPVVRVTAKFAFVKVNPIAEVKYRREVGAFDAPIPTLRDPWDSTRRTAFTPVKS